MKSLIKGYGKEGSLGYTDLEDRVFHLVVSSPLRMDMLKLHGVSETSFLSFNRCKEREDRLQSRSMMESRAFKRA
jgi:hypothetical protein